MIRALIDPPLRSPRTREIFDPILSSCSWEKWLLPRSTQKEHLHICGDISESCRFKARMAAREVKMIVARYFSAIRHPPVLVASAFCPELFRLFQSTTTEFARPSRLAHWGGINSDYPLKSLAKSIGFVSLQQRVKRSSGVHASAQFEDSTR